MWEKQIIKSGDKNETDLCYKWWQVHSPYFLKHISFWQEAGSQTGQSQKNCDVQQQHLEELEQMES